MFFLDGFRHAMVAQKISTAAVGNEVRGVHGAFRDLHVVWEVFITNFGASPFTEMLSQRKQVIIDKFSRKANTKV